MKDNNQTQVEDQKFTDKVLRDDAVLSSDNFTGFYDINNVPIFIGDTLKSKWDYMVKVMPDNTGKLICDENHPCKDIPYSLNEGKDYSKVI